MRILVSVLQSRRHALTLCLLVLLAGLVASTGMLGLRFEGDLSRFLADDHPQAQAQKEADALFKTTAPVGLALSGGTLADRTRALSILHSHLEVHPDARSMRLVSLATEPYVELLADELSATPLVPRFDTSPDWRQVADRIEQAIRAPGGLGPMGGNLVSEDLGHLLMVAYPPCIPRRCTRRVRSVSRT